MAARESWYAVWLNDVRVGSIHQRGDHTRFTLAEGYRADPDRPVLGLRFEQDLDAVHAAALRLPPWFSNLLPEGRLRNWIAADRHVSADREMELLAQVGHDLPGAVLVMPEDMPAGMPGHPEVWGAGGEKPTPASTPDEVRGWRFSLAGVGLKFSMVTVDDSLRLPAYGEGGDWIVKLPDHQHRDVPRNEYTMMSLAHAAGVDVPECRLVHRDQLVGLPAHVWPGPEEWAYAVRRFDRDPARQRVHIEDFAQVRGMYAVDKYRGTYETLAALIYRRHDVGSLREFARRLAFCVLVSNGDAHLKNWSLIYRDPRAPTLSPAYDIVATAPYRHASDGPEDLALKFGGSRRFESVGLASFDRLEKRLGVRVGLADDVADLVDRVGRRWPEHSAKLGDNDAIRTAVGDSIRAHSRSLLRNRD